MADRDPQNKLGGLVDIKNLLWTEYLRKRGRGGKNKAKLIIAVSVWKDKNVEEGPGFDHTFVAEDASAETFGSILRRLGANNHEITPLIDVIPKNDW